MRERWQPVAILAGVLFVINAIARFVTWTLVTDNANDQLTIGLVAMGAVAVVMVGAGYWWARQYAMPRVVGELAVAILVACALSIGIGPFAGGSVPGREGAAFLIAEIWQYLGLAGLGGVLGVLIAIAAGQDRKSQAWKRYADNVQARPRRPVRR